MEFGVFITKNVKKKNSKYTHLGTKTQKHMIRTLYGKITLPKTFT